MRSIHLVIATIIVVAIMLLTHKDEPNKATSAKKQQINHVLRDDAQYVPSILGNSEYDDIHSQLNPNRHYLFPRIRQIFTQEIYKKS